MKKSHFSQISDFKIEENFEKDGIESPSIQVKGLFLVFYEDINLSTKFGSLYILISYFRDILIPFTIISLTWRPRLQFYLISVYLLLKLIFLLIFRPFSSTWKNLLEIANDIIYISIICLYVILLKLGEGIEPIRKYFYIGYPIIALVISLFLLNILNQVKELFEIVLPKNFNSNINEIEVLSTGKEKKRIDNQNFVFEKDLNNYHNQIDPTEFTHKRKLTKLKSKNFGTKLKIKRNTEMNTFGRDDRFLEEKNINGSNGNILQQRNKKKIENTFLRFTRKTTQRWSKHTNMSIRSGKNKQKEYSQPNH